MILTTVLKFLFILSRRAKSGLKKRRFCRNKAKTPPLQSLKVWDGGEKILDINDGSDNAKGYGYNEYSPHCRIPFFRRTCGAFDELYLVVGNKSDKDRSYRKEEGVMVKRTLEIQPCYIHKHSRCSASRALKSCELVEEAGDAVADRERDYEIYRSDGE